MGDVPGAKDTGKTGQVNYAIGSTKGRWVHVSRTIMRLTLSVGPIKTATLNFEGFTVKNQAFSEYSKYAHSMDRPMGNLQRV